MIQKLLYEYFASHKENFPNGFGTPTAIAITRFSVWLEERLTKYALDAALVAPAEQLSNSVIVPAGEVDSQPRQ